MKNIPFILDLTNRFKNQLAQFGGSVDRLKGFYSKFGFDCIPYDGIKRWGDDSSTESSDIHYDDIKEGHCLYFKEYKGYGIKWSVIRVTHKYDGVIFFKTVGEKEKKKSYVDTGCSDYWWSSAEPSRYTLPKHIFYPMEVIKPEWVNIDSWYAPSEMKVTNIK